VNCASGCVSSGLNSCVSLINCSDENPSAAADRDAKQLRPCALRDCTGAYFPAQNVGYTAEASKSEIAVSALGALWRNEGGNSSNPKAFARHGGQAEQAV
jgi:hypothetical protein